MTVQVTPRVDEFRHFHERLKHRETYILLGVQGSGTNLLANVLQEVFDVSVVRDRSLIVGSAARLSENPSRAEVDRQTQKVLTSLFPNPLRKRLLDRAYYNQAERYRGIDEHIRSVSIESPADLADFFYSYHAFVAGKSHKAIKSDDIWQYLPAIERVIPNRRYIMLVRDPRDNALSITNKKWGPCHIFFGSRFVKDQLKLYGEEMARNAEASMTVKYETLLNDPQAFISHFAAFSGIAPLSDTEHKLQHLNIRSTNFQKWKRLPTESLAICESVLGNELDKYGYARSGTDCSAITKGRMLQMRWQDVRKRVPQRFRHTWRMRVLSS